MKPSDPHDLDDDRFTSWLAGEPDETDLRHAHLTHPSAWFRERFPVKKPTGRPPAGEPAEIEGSTT